jgi:hypothetical protein
MKMTSMPVSITTNEVSCPFLSWWIFRCIPLFYFENLVLPTTDVTPLLALHCHRFQKEGLVGNRCKEVGLPTGHLPYLQLGEAAFSGLALEVPAVAVACCRGPC